MGQAASRRQRHSDDLICQNLDKEIEKVRRQIKAMKKEGVKQRALFKEEIYLLNRQQNDRKKILRYQGKRAESTPRYWEYLDIVQRTIHAKKSAPLLTNSDNKKYSSGAIVKISLKGVFNMIQFLEATLLRRLKFSVTLKSQRESQTKGWNDTIMSIHFLKENDIQEGFESRKRDLAMMKLEKKGRVKKIQDSYKKILEVQKLIIDKYIAASQADAVSRTGSRSKFNPHKNTREQKEERFVEMPITETAWHSKSKAKVGASSSELGYNAAADDDDDDDPLFTRARPQRNMQLSLGVLQDDVPTLSGRNMRFSIGLAEEDMDIPVKNETGWSMRDVEEENDDDDDMPDGVFELGPRTPGDGNTDDIVSAQEKVDKAKEFLDDVMS